MKLKLSESSLALYAENYSYDSVGEEEARLMEIGVNVRSKGYASKDELQALVNWKSYRSAGLIRLNSDSFIKEVTKFSLRTQDERAKVSSLTLITGVAYPVASAYLHFFDSGTYPIIDFRAIWSLGEKVPSKYTFDFWMKYVNYTRNLANKTGMSMRDLDRALWQYSKENQPPKTS